MRQHSADPAPARVMGRAFVALVAWLLCTAAMPAYPFLFTEAPVGAAIDPLAVGQADGRSVVPTRRAMDLAAYLLALNSQHAYGPETAHNTIAPKAAPLWPIARWNRPRDTGEIMCTLTLKAPADWPKMVTHFGSPPKAAMLLRTQANAPIWSIRP